MSSRASDGGSTPAPDRVRRTGFRLGRGPVVLVLLGISLALLALSQPLWLTATGPAAAGQVSVPGTGRQVAPLVPAAAVALAGAALASTLAQRTIRVVVLVVAALACLAVVLGCAAVLRDPVGAGSAVLSASTGARSRAGSTTLTWAPWAATGLGAVGMVLSLAGIGAPAATRTSRFDTRAGGAAGEPSLGPAGTWDALSRGQDPT